MDNLDPAAQDYHDQWLLHGTQALDIMTRIEHTLLYISRMKRQYAILYDSAMEIWWYEAPPPAFIAGEQQY
jgi:hypothetical protein